MAFILSKVWELRTPCYGVWSNYTESGVIQRLWGQAEWNRTGPVCVGWPGQCYLQGKLEAYLKTPQNECSSPPPTLATVPLFCIHQGWKPCRKFAGYFPIAQALLHHYDVTPSLCFRILWKMGPRQPLPTKWNIFATLDMSDEGVRELFCFNQERAKNTNTHFKAPGNLSFLPFSRLSWNHADMRTSKQHRGLGV